MTNRINPGGNGHAGKDMVDMCPIGEYRTLLLLNPTHPPEEELHIALADVLQTFLFSNPIRVRSTPKLNQGNDAM